LHLARQRAFTETCALLRVALECGSTALHIASDAVAFESYQKDEYHSTRAIAHAKKSIPILGEVWGALSQTSVHVTPVGFGPKIEFENNSARLGVTLEFGSRKTKPIQDQVILALICLVSTMILKIAELILFEKSPDYEGALRLRGTGTIYMTNSDAKIGEYDQQFRGYVEAAAKESVNKETI
jgi:hypothetical protein